MKTKTLFAVLLLLAFSQSKASPSLAPEEAEHFKERAHDMLVDYYASLPLLVGVKMPDDEKEEIALKLITYNFRSPSATVFNDYQKNANIKELPIKEYLGQLNALYYDEKLGITFTDPIVTVNGVYMAGDSFLVKTVVEWSLVSAGKPELNTTSTIDYYFSFSPGVEDIRVYRMTDHRDNISLLVPAPIESKSYITANTNTNPSSSNITSQNINPTFFTFKVTPNNATVSVDGKPIYYCNGLKFVTAPGNKRIEITAPGYQPYVLNSFNVKEGNNNITAELIQNMGALTVGSANKKAESAQILIDGKLVGNIPASRIPLSEGLHSVQIVKGGYFSKRKNITIKAQHDEKWNVDMVNVEHLKTAGKVIGGIGAYLLRGGH